MCLGLHVKCLLFLSDFKETLIFFTKNIQISHFMKIHPVRSELFQAVIGTDGQTDRQTHDEANSLFSQFCERT